MAEIWRFNATDRGPAHADRYLAFLEGRLRKLSNDYRLGRPISRRQDLRFMLMRRGKRGHGHVAIYAVVGMTVLVAHDFHTAQDWESNLI